MTRFREAWVAFLATRAVEMAVDAAVVSVSYFAALSIRLDFQPPSWGWRATAQSCILVCAVYVAAHLLCGCYRLAWRRVSAQELPRYGIAAVLACAILTVMRIALPDIAFAHIRPPYSVTVILFFLAFAGVMGVRVLWRVYWTSCRSDAALLERGEKTFDNTVAARFFAGRTVMVTGAGGSIGSEIVRQVVSAGAARVLLVERCENALYEIDRQVRAVRRGVGVPLMVDAGDRERMSPVFASERPSVVLHAAAYKHVPMVEMNPEEGWRNNEGATRTLAGLAVENGVERFVLISTDKAVNPVSVMGRTKLAAERAVMSMNAPAAEGGDADASGGGTSFCAVRFGNVFGSSGSVVPLFREQIAKGGPVTVTHPDMKRYFMTIQEAVSLVLQAASRPERAIYTLDMGEPVRILDLAEGMIRQAGLRPYIDIPITFTGPRPGEKLFEEIDVSDRSCYRTDMAKIYVTRAVAWLACAAAAFAADPARADCLDELMPRPRKIWRGSPKDVGCVKAPAGRGAYQLVVAGGSPSVQGDAEGRRYAAATFDQLRRLAAADGASVPDCVINDWPEFRYRGLLLDCGRNYQDVRQIKEVIAVLAAYKYNLFHWHLTDNYGWRLESRRHPELQRDDAFLRDRGKFYTQEEFREVLAFARERGVTVVPEMDMPGHTLAFRRATGIRDLSSDRARVVLGELIDELCSLATAEEMPIVHLGTDEARERGEKVPQSHLDWWAGRVVGSGRILMGWSPGLRLPGQSVKHLWMGAKDPRGDRTPYIDSQNSFYINHVDPEELLSVAAYQQPCRWGARDEKLGAIIGVWHDDAIAGSEDVVRMNAVYPAAVLLSDSFWRGREKDEPDLYARLPNPGDPRFALAADLERRAVAHRDKLFAGSRLPFPFVAQTSMRWRMTDADGALLADDIPQATVYPRHFWFPAGAYAPGADGVVRLETWIRSPRDVECGAWIGMTGFSRSDGRGRDAPTPSLGQWNKHGATVEVNGRAISPPEWTHPGMSGNPRETPLADEDYWYRPPSRISLKRGLNRVRIVLPKKGGWKWIGTFVPVAGTSDHPREVPGLEYFSARPAD